MKPSLKNLQCLISKKEEDKDYLEINIGSNLNPKIVKIGKDTFPQERNVDFGYVWLNIDLIYSAKVFD